LDIVAEGLNELQQVNVTVLYRPFHAMNGAWFWWGNQVIFYRLTFLSSDYSSA
jgi:beta-mannanase